MSLVTTQDKLAAFLAGWPYAGFLGMTAKLDGESGAATLPGYKKVLCPDDGSAEVDLAGFIEGQALGYVGPPLSEPHGPRTPVRAIGTEFDIHVRKQTPGQCPINPAG